MSACFMVVAVQYVRAVTKCTLACTVSPWHHTCERGQLEPARSMWVAAHRAKRHRRRCHQAKRLIVRAGSSRSSELWRLSARTGIPVIDLIRVGAGLVSLRERPMRPARSSCARFNGSPPIPTVHLSTSGRTFSPGARAGCTSKRPGHCVPWPFCFQLAAMTTRGARKRAAPA